MKIICFFGIFVFSPIFLFSTSDPPKATDGPLVGKNIIISQGHGLRYNDALNSWGYERPEIVSQEGLRYREDLGVNLINRHLRNYLISNGGAEVRNVREMVIDDKVIFTDPWPGNINPNKPRWHISPRYYMRKNIYGENIPETVYNPTVDREHAKNLRSRVYYCNWYLRNFTPSKADIYVSLHTNADASLTRGTETLYANDSTTSFIDYDGTNYTVDVSIRNSCAVLAKRLNDRIVQVMRAHYDAAWVDRGIKIRNDLVETVRPRVPAALIEYAFHTAIGPPTTKDFFAIATDEGQRLLAQATYKGICDYFQVEYNLPSRITDLYALPGSTYGTVILTWTAPGEGGTIPAKSYIVKYSLQPINTETDFANATAYSQTWKPVSRYQKETKVIYGLTPGQVYYFAIKSKNDTNDISKISNNASTRAGGSLDNPPPGNTRDFIAIPNPMGERIDLRWTNPDDPDYNGIRIRYRTDGLYPMDPDDGILVGDFSKHTTYYFHTELTPGTTYYYRAFTYDTASNYASGVTASAYVLSPSVFLFGYVKDTQDKPIPGAICLLTPGNYTAVADASGYYRFTLANIQAGTYTLTVSSRGYITWRDSVGLPSRGEIVQNIILVVGARIYGVVTDASRGDIPLSGVNCILTGPINLQTQTDNGGNYEFDGLPAGDYTLKFTKIGCNEHKQRISVSSGEHKRVDVQLLLKPVLADVVIEDKIFTPTGATNTKAQINFNISPGSKPRVKIFNIQGKQVREIDATDTHLVNISDISANFSWDGKDDNYKDLPAGIYFYQIEVDGKFQTGKIILAK